MDQTQLQKQIALSYSKLPTDVQKAFSSMAWMDTLKNISIKYGLNENQIQTLGTETTLVFLGIIHLDEYENNLTTELNIPTASIEKMIGEINDLILKPIRPQLTEVYAKHAESLVEEKYGNIEKLDERFAKLPKEVQEAISESDYQSTLYDIASGKKLNVEQMGILEEVTNKVLLGIIHPDKYEAELKEKLGLPANTTSEIVTAVNDGVLNNIREILKSHWNKEEAEVKNIDDEVPIPPYAQAPLSQTSALEKIVQPVALEAKQEVPPPAPAPLSNTESGIYSKAGIEVMDDEKPEDDLAKSIIASKLSMATASKQTTTDYSIPKISGQDVPPPPPPVQAPVKPAHDPYHEEITN